MKVKSKSILGQKVKYVYEKIEGYVGLCEALNKTIRIHSDLKGKELVSTILHEEFHFVWHASGLNQTSVHPDIQEVIVETFSQFISTHYDLKVKKPK